MPQEERPRKSGPLSGPVIMMVLGAAIAYLPWSLQTSIIWKLLIAVAGVLLLLTGFMLAK